MTATPTEQLIQRDLEKARSERNSERERCALICETRRLEFYNMGELVIAAVLKNISNEIRGK